MDDVTRRSALGLVAAVGAATLAGTPAAAQDRQKGEDGGNPEGWGKEGDQSFKVGDVSAEAMKFKAKVAGLVDPKDNLAGFGLAETGEVLMAAAVKSNNCNAVKDEINRRFKVVRFGSCSHAAPALADTEAAALMAQVIADGGVLNTEFGHRTVRNRVGPVKYNTYLAYAGGDRP